jgi:hypothetical protein
MFVGSHFPFRYQLSKRHQCYFGKKTWTNHGTDKHVSNSSTKSRCVFLWSARGSNFFRLCHNILTDLKSENRISQAQQELNTLAIIYHWPIKKTQTKVKTIKFRFTQQFNYFHFQTRFAIDHR